MISHKARLVEGRTEDKTCRPMFRHLFFTPETSTSMSLFCTKLPPWCGTSHRDSRHLQRVTNNYTDLLDPVPLPSSVSGAILFTERKYSGWEYLSLPGYFIVSPFLPPNLQVLEVIARCHCCVTLGGSRLGGVNDVIPKYVPIRIASRSDVGMVAWPSVGMWRASARFPTSG